MLQKNPNTLTQHEQEENYTLQCSERTLQKKKKKMKPYRTEDKTIYEISMDVEHVESQAISTVLFNNVLDTSFFTNSSPDSQGAWVTETFRWIIVGLTTQLWVDHCQALSLSSTRHISRVTRHPHPHPWAPPHSHTHTHAVVEEGCV